jgi:hypothetical protein
VKRVTQGPLGVVPATENFETLLREEDLQHVAVLDEVGLALGAQPAVLARLSHRTQLEQVLVSDRLGPDEAPGKVRVDRAGGIDGR